MKPVLYGKYETEFITNGIGILSDCLECTVAEKRNGAYEAELVYPVNGRLYEHIAEGCFFKAKPNETSDLQIFKIYASSKPMNGTVRFMAEHISYSLSGIPIESVEIKSGSAQYALDKILAAGIHEHKYTAYSDIDTLGSASLSLISVRAALGGAEHSVLDIYGGEFEFDNFNIKLHRSRGKDTGIIIAYGKNLTDINQERSISEMYTAIYPYAIYTPEPDAEQQPTEVTVTLPEKVIASSVIQNEAYPKTLIKDFTDQFEEGEAITPEALREKATCWMKASGFDVPRVSITVSFKALWESGEYRHLAALERVRLCDTLTVSFPKLGVNAKAKVIKTVYDCLGEKYKSVELGDTRANIASEINKNSSDIASIKQDVKNRSTAVSARLASAIADVTAAITGQKGGHVVLNPSSSPQEILILDAPSISEALNVWRWNSAGLGYSDNGYNGPYTAAITSDGRIVADLITAGILRGELLEAGSVRASALSASYKNEVTNEITGATGKVEQAFVVADEQLRSLIKDVSVALSDEREHTEERFSRILQTVSELSVSFTERHTGGINCIVNSSGLNGISAEWEYSGSVQTVRNTDTESNTVSGSCFMLNGGTLLQQIPTVSGTVYTLTLKAKKTNTSGSIKITCADTEHYMFSTSERFEWTEFDVTFVSPSNVVTVEMMSLGDSLYAADLMLAEGEGKHRWSPAPNEIYTANAKIDRYGVFFSGAEDGSMTAMNSTEFAVFSEGEKVVAINKDSSVIPELEVGELEAAGLKIFKVNGGVDIALTTE